MTETTTTAAVLAGRPAGRLVHHGGRLVPPAEATLPVGSLAMRYAVSVFEGIRLYVQRAGGVRAWLLAEHLDRLRESCRLLGFDDDVCDSVPGVMDEVVAANAVAEDSYCRVSVSAGNAGDIGAVPEPLLTVSVTPMGRKKWLAEGRGMRLAVSRWQRTPAAAFPAAAKNISNYAGPGRALAEAKQAGYDNCVLVTAAGLVSEAPTAALFAVRDGRLTTPRLTDDVLPSITRGWVLAVADALGIQAATGPVSPADLAGADEAFLCGSGLEFGPVASVGGTALAACPGPVTGRLVDEYFRQVRGEAPAPAALPWQRV